MQYILSCAKTMTNKSVMAPTLKTVPIFKAEAFASALILQGYSIEELKKLFKCSDAIAKENKLRYKNFFDEEKLNPAILSYTGVAYKSMDPSTFTSSDFEYANNHLYITSFLYGLLRPMDMIQNYRLEGKAKIHGGISMFDYWKPRLTDILLENVKKDDGVLVHIATEEMTHLFEWKKVAKEVDVVEPTFMVNDGKKEKIVTVYAKMCRGAMAAYLIKKQCRTIDEIRNFRYEGFRYAGEERGETLKMKFLLE